MSDLAAYSQALIAEREAAKAASAAEAAEKAAAGVAAKIQKAFASHGDTEARKP